MLLLPISIAWVRIHLEVLRVFTVAAHSIAAARTASLRAPGRGHGTRFTCWRSDRESQLVKMRLQFLHYCLLLLDGAAFLLQAFFDALLADPVPHLFLHTAIIGVADALGVLAGLDVLVHRIISRPHDLPLAELDSAATVLQAEGAEIATAASVPRTLR